jgi:capsid protein
MNFGFSTGALKPKQPSLVERGVDPDDVFRQTRRGEKRRREAEE